MLSVRRIKKGKNKEFRSDPKNYTTLNVIAVSDWEVLYYRSGVSVQGLMLFLSSNASQSPGAPAKSQTFMQHRDIFKILQ